MRKKIVSLLLACAMVLGVTVPGVWAAPPEEDLLQKDLFFMRAVPVVQGETERGAEFTVEIYGGLAAAGDHTMETFGFRLDYDAAQLELLELQAAGVFQVKGFCEKNLETASLSYNAADAKGIALATGDGTKLATAKFKVLTTADANLAEIALADAEIVRPQDKESTLGRTESARVQLRPVLRITSVKDDAAAVEFHQNPAGRLVVAVYDGKNHMLRCEFVQDIPEKAEPVTVPIWLRGGVYVRAFLVDQNDRPLCRAAEWQIPMLELPKTGSAESGSVTVHCSSNPAGTLAAVVYDEAGRMLAFHAEQGIPADAGDRELALPLSGGARVRVMLVDSETCRPLGAYAEMQLQ